MRWFIYFSSYFIVIIWATEYGTAEYRQELIYNSQLYVR